MKILYITSQPILINSSANLRNVALIKGLMELGHDVKILNMKVTENAANYDNSMKAHLKNVNIEYINPIRVHNKMVVKKGNKKSLLLICKDILRNLYICLSFFRKVLNRDYLCMIVLRSHIKRWERYLSLRKDLI